MIYKRRHIKIIEMDVQCELNTFSWVKCTLKRTNKFNLTQFLIILITCLPFDYFPRIYQWYEIVLFEKRMPDKHNRANSCLTISSSRQ